MSNILKYKGYYAKVEYSVEDNVWYGKIEDICDLVPRNSPNDLEMPKNRDKTKWREKERNGFKWRYSRGLQPFHSPSVISNYALYSIPVIFTIAIHGYRRFLIEKGDRLHGIPH